MAYEGGNATVHGTNDYAHFLLLLIRRLLLLSFPQIFICLVSCCFCCVFLKLSISHLLSSFVSYSSSDQKIITSQNGSPFGPILIETYLITTLTSQVLLAETFSQPSTARPLSIHLLWTLLNTQPPLTTSSSSAI